MRRDNRIEQCLNKSVSERAGWAQNENQDALKKDSAKASRWKSWKGQVSDVKKDAYFREHIGLENKVLKQMNYFSGNPQEYRPCLSTPLHKLNCTGVFYQYYV